MDKFPSKIAFAKGIIIEVSWYKSLVNPFLNFTIAWTKEFGWIRMSNLFKGMLNNLWASINSNILFINVDESIVIFFPIFHFGWIKASFGSISLNLEIFKFKKGPPEAVKNIFSIFSISEFLISSCIE